MRRRAAWRCGIKVVNKDWCLKLGGSILGGYISCLREHKPVKFSIDVAYPPRKSCSR